jgi:hypothetical protein
MTLTQRGPTTIKIVVRDVPNPPKQTTDTRVVYWDDAAPSLSFTPGSDVSTFNTTIAVSGVADDDAGIKRITVNGAQIAFTTTSNPLKPKEVSFATTVALSPGGNPLAVVVTDISDRITSETRTVTQLTQKGTTLTATDVTAPYGGGATLVARLLDQDQLPVAGKTVRFTVFGTPIDATTSATGHASVNVNLGSQPAGATLFTVQFAGDTGFAASSDSGQLTIAAGEASITLSALTHVYDGAPKSATATTTPSGLSGVTITYNGNATPPTAAGSYAVVASLSNPNVQAPSATGTLVIARASATVTLSGLSAVYDGSPKAVGVITAPASLAGVNVTYNGSTEAPTNAGSYAVAVTLTNPNFEAAQTDAVLVIAKAPASLTLSGLNTTYDGSPRTVTVTTSPSGLGSVSITYDGSAIAPTNAGRYALVARLFHSNYEAPDATGALLIAKRDQTISFAALPARTFGDPPFTVSATSSAGLPVAFDAGPNCAAAGSLVTLMAGGQCTVTASQAGDNNHHAAVPVARSFTVAYSWSGVLQPVNNDGSSVFKAGSTVPIKFQLTGASATVTNLAARIYLTSVSNGVLGTEVEALSQVAADSGNVFRYDPIAGQYVFNLSTRGMTQGTWRVRVDLLDGTERSVLLSLRR